MELFDSHCHFDFDAFDSLRTSLWQDCRQAGLQGMVIPGVSPEQWPRLFALAEGLDGISGAAGLHPWWSQAWLTENQEQTLESLLLPWLQNQQCVALGECGLDAMIDLPLAQQAPLFELQLQLACEKQLPVIVHVRRAHNETLQLVKRYKPARGGVIHGFSGSLELAQQYWRLGFRIGVGGTITYDRARKTRTAVAKLPGESLVLETDAPDMPLAGHQGEPNNPLYLVDVAMALAQLRGETVADIARQTTENSLQLFDISAD